MFENIYAVSDQEDSSKVHSDASDLTTTHTVASEPVKLVKSQKVSVSKVSCPEFDTFWVCSNGFYRVT